MKKTLLAILFCLATSPALSLDPYSRIDSNPGFVDKGVKTYNPEFGSTERVGVTCNLYLNFKRVHDGYCKVGRRDTVTVISTGTSVYKIVRDSNSTARFYQGLNSSDYIGSVHTQGNCWVSDDPGKIQFCAD